MNKEIHTYGVHSYKYNTFETQTRANLIADN